VSNSGAHRANALKGDARVTKTASLTRLRWWIKFNFSALYAPTLFKGDAVVKWVALPRPRERIVFNFAKSRRHQVTVVISRRKGTRERRWSIARKRLRFFDAARL
jgi:hypothetical protein